HRGLDLFRPPRDVDEAGLDHRRQRRLLLARDVGDRLLEITSVDVLLQTAQESLLVDGGLAEQHDEAIHRDGDHEDPGDGDRIHTETAVLPALRQRAEEPSTFRCRQHRQKASERTHTCNLQQTRSRRPGPPADRAWRIVDSREDRVPGMSPKRRETLAPALLGCQAAAPMATGNFRRADKHGRIFWRAQVRSHHGKPLSLGADRSKSMIRAPSRYSIVSYLVIRPSFLMISAILRASFSSAATWRASGSAGSMRRARSCA